MNPIEFVRALFDDLTGKDANGRSADEKRAYSYGVMALLAAAAVGAVFVWPPLAVVPGAVLARKIWLHRSNQF